MDLHTGERAVPQLISERSCSDDEAIDHQPNDVGSVVAHPGIGGASGEYPLE